jgi:hypothetical protein
MSRKQDKVAEFQSIVDTLIHNQVETARSRRVSWLDYDKIAKVNDYTYVSVGEHDTRPIAVGIQREHIWGVMTPKLKLGRYSGHLAVVSRENQPEALFRRISFAARIGISIDTEKPIFSLKGLTSTLDWVKSPHLQPEVFSQLCELTAKEVKCVSAEMAEDAEQSRRLQADLEELSRARRVPIPNIFIH